MPRDLYAYFLGEWSFLRDMQGADGVALGSAEGTAQFHPSQQPQQSGPGVLHYRETGTLRLLADQRVISFSRQFTYQVTQDIVDVAFADGPQAGQAYQRYRYDPQQQALVPLATHVCLQDHYDGSYQLLDEQHFSLRTRIAGPHKDYVLATRFTRVASPSGNLS